MLCASASEVNGPVAITTIASVGISSISSLIISMFSICFILFVMLSANFSLSTAKACPAGTEFSSAVFINNESSIRNSCFNKPHAFVILFDLKELLHTISAKFGFECAGENFLGFISYNFTFKPLLAI